MVVPRRLALSVFAVLLVGTVATVAMPPPGPVCEHCAPDYHTTAADSGVDVRVAESAAVVHLHENGSATWLVGLRLTGPDADRVQTNESLHERLARDVTGDRFGGVGRGSLTHVSADPVDVGEGAVYYRFHDGDFARPGVGGTLVSTRLREDFAVANYDSLGVDRLTVEAPAMQLTRAPPSATTVDGLRGSAFTITRVDQAIVTFAPGVASTPVELLWMELLSALAVAEFLLPVVVGNVSVLLLPALVSHALVLGVILGVLGRLKPPEATETARTVVTALFGGAAAVGVTQPFYGTAVALPVIGAQPSPIAVGLGAGAATIAVGLAQPRRAGLLFGRRSSTALERAERLAGTAVLAAAAGGVLTGWVLAGPTAWDGLGLALTVTAPTAAFLPATTSALDGRLRRGVVVVVVGFLLGGFAAPALYSRPQGVVFSGFLLAPALTGTLLAVGWPCFLAGWALEGATTTVTRGQS